MGWALLSLNRNAEAVAIFTEADELKPHNPAAKADLAYALGSANQYRDALQVLERVLAPDVDDSWALNIAAGMLCDVALYTAAVDVTRRNLATHPSDGMAWKLQGWALENLGDGYWESALEAYEAALGVRSDDLDSLRGRGDVLHKLKRYDSAHASWQEAVEESSKQIARDPGALATLGWCYLRLGQQDQAIKLITQASLTPTAQESVAFDLGLAQLWTGQLIRAVRQYQLATKQARACHRYRQRGLFQVACADLAIMLEEQPHLASKEEVLAIQTRLDNARTSLFKERIRVAASLQGN